MAENRERFSKIIAVAVNPGAYEEEAVAALRRARALVKEDPSLAHPVAASPPPKPAPAEDHSYQTRISNITALRLPLIMSSLSAEAYGHGLKSKLEVEFVAGKTDYTLNVRCDGTEHACEAFAAYLSWLIEFHNTHPIPS